MCTSTSSRITNTTDIKCAELQVSTITYDDYNRLHWTSALHLLISSSVFSFYYLLLNCAWIAPIDTCATTPRTVMLKKVFHVKKERWISNLADFIEKDTWPLSNPYSNPLDNFWLRLCMIDAKWSKDYENTKIGGNSRNFESNFHKMGRVACNPIS